MSDDKIVQNLTQISSTPSSDPRPAPLISSSTLASKIGISSRSSLCRSPAHVPHIPRALSSSMLSMRDRMNSPHGSARSQSSASPQKMTSVLASLSNSLAAIHTDYSTNATLSSTHVVMSLSPIARNRVTPSIASAAERLPRTSRSEKVEGKQSAYVFLRTRSLYVLVDQGEVASCDVRALGLADGLDVVALAAGS